MKRMIGVCLAALLLAAVCVGCGGSGKSGMELENGAETAEIVSPYSGQYLEYGDRELVTDLCAMRFTNTGERTISDAQFTLPMDSGSWPSGWKCCLWESLFWWRS